MDGESSLFEWMEEYSGPQAPSSVRMKRKVRSRRKEFVGWGSRQLIEFLQSLGKDTSKKISQNDVTAIVNEYVNAKKLLDPAKKKRIVCDESLLSIFGRKTISRIKIHDLLEAHFADNLDDSDDDSLYSSDEKENCLGSVVQENRTTSEKKSYPKARVIETPKSCFAAIIPGNINLVYLRKSLVEDLLKDPENFESKLVGSFVRIKADPDDYLQRNSHQLVQVLGVKKTSSISARSSEVLLQVSSVVKDIHIRMLSDDNFSEEECNDLFQRVRDGLFKRLTVEELQQKAQMLHVDITKHWLAKEILLLQSLIDRANEKGWRRELYQYLEKKQLLQTADERERLLQEFPKVIAEEMVTEASRENISDHVEQGDSGSPVPPISRTSEMPICVERENGLDSTSTLKTSIFKLSESQPHVVRGPLGQVSEIVWSHSETQLGNVTNQLWHESVNKQANVTNQLCHELVNKHSNVTNQLCHESVNKQAITTEVIDLSDDEEIEETSVREEQVPNNTLESMIWHYLDPQGDIQGPFSLTSLKRWSDADYFPSDFKVWKMGQNQDQAVLLEDILSQICTKDI